MKYLFLYNENREKINKIRKYFCYFVIFTTDLNASVNDILQSYRNKDTEEKAFCEMKQHINEKMPRVYNQDVFDGKYFIVFLSLICKRWILNKLESFKKIKHYTFKRCILKLNDVRILQEDKKFRLLKAITDEQREMLQLCGVDVERLEETARLALRTVS